MGMGPNCNPPFGYFYFFYFEKNLGYQQKGLFWAGKGGGLSSECILENEISGIVRRPVECSRLASSEQMRGWGSLVTSKSPMGKFRATSTCEVPTFCTVIVQELIEGSLFRLLTRMFFVNESRIRIRIQNQLDRGIRIRHCAGTVMVLALYTKVADPRIIDCGSGAGSDII